MLRSGFLQFKNPYIIYRGHKQMNLKTLFSHPDYTVGFGISPNQLLMQVADYTAGGELRPAPKKY